MLCGALPLRPVTHRWLVPAPIAMNASTLYDNKTKTHKTRTTHTHVNTQQAVTVLANRTALYKHLASNCVAVVTASTRDVEFDELFVHLIDAASGRVVHRTVVRDARPPVLLALSENTSNHLPIKFLLLLRLSKCQIFDILFFLFSGRYVCQCARTSLRSFDERVFCADNRLVETRDRRCT
jgi:hypothetical protein